MKSIPPVLLGLAMAAMPVSAAEQIVTLGDSLTFAYEAEFCFQQVTPFGTFGDNMPPHVRNWVELLSSTTITPAPTGSASGPNACYRDRFELGARDSVLVTPPVGSPFTLYFRQAHNWAIPGLKADGMRQLVAGEAKFNDLINFDDFNTLLSYSDFNQDVDFALADFENQVTNIAERVVIAIGGNDIRGVYGTIYDGNSPGTFVPDFVADISAVIDRVQTLKPGIQIVLVNVPHVGITPIVKGSYPYNVVNTERVSAVLRNLNGQLALLASAKGIGYADIYTPTLPMITTSTDFGIYGMNYTNGGSASGTAGNCWLNGDLSNNFHPNTQGQALIANEVIDAFNRRYQTGIAPLTVTQIGGITSRGNGQMNPNFTDWATRSGVAGQAANTDSDGDGISLGVEYLTNLEPTRHDSWKIAQRLVGGNLELSYPLRFAGTPPGGTVRGAISVESSTTLSSPFSPVTPPAMGTDGLIRATIPASGPRAFMRLKATIN